jgi:hypothetical protein
MLVAELAKKFSALYLIDFLWSYSQGALLDPILTQIKTTDTVGNISGMNF